MKFNCEGAEFKILLSTPVALLEKVDKILILYHLDLANDMSTEPLISHLKSAGFYTEIRQERGDKERGWLIAVRGTVMTLAKLFFKRNYYVFRIKLGATVGAAVRRVIKRPRQ